MLKGIWRLTTRRKPEPAEPRGEDKAAAEEDTMRSKESKKTKTQEQTDEINNFFRDDIARIDYD